jgi:hypothetical protein
MIEIILIILCLIIAMLCRSLVHTLLHHFGEFLLKWKIKNIRWWHPAISWKNKYLLDEDEEPIMKDGEPIRNKKIVQFSDAFHFFNMIELGAFVLAITISLAFVNDTLTWLLGLAWYMSIVIFLIVGAILIIIFNIGYDRLWR